MFSFGCLGPHTQCVRGPTPWKVAYAEAHQKTAYASADAFFFTAHAERQPLAAQPMQSCLRLKISKCLREELNAAQLTQHTMQFPFYLDFMILKKAMLNSRSGCMLSTSQICCCIDNLNYYIIPIVAASLIFPCSYVPGLSDVRVQRHPNGW